MLKTLKEIETACEDCFQRHFGSLNEGELKSAIKKFYEEMKSLAGIQPVAAEPVPAAPPAPEQATLPAK